MVYLGGLDFQRPLDMSTPKYPGISRNAHENHNEILFYTHTLKNIEMSDYSKCWQECGILIEKKAVQECRVCGGQNNSRGVIHSKNKYLLSNHYVPGTVLDAGDAADSDRWHILLPRS